MRASRLLAVRGARRFTITRRTTSRHSFSSIQCSSSVRHVRRTPGMTYQFYATSSVPPSDSNPTSKPTTPFVNNPSKDSSSPTTATPAGPPPTSTIQSTPNSKPGAKPNTDSVNKPTTPPPTSTPQSGPNSKSGTTNPQSNPFGSTPTTATPAGPPPTSTPQSSPNSKPGAKPNTDPANKPTTPPPSTPPNSKPGAKPNTDSVSKPTTPPSNAPSSKSGSYYSVAAKPRPPTSSNPLPGVPPGVYVPPPEQTGRPLLPGEQVKVSAQRVAFIILFAIFILLLCAYIFYAFSDEVFNKADPDEERLKRVVESPLPAKRKAITHSPSSVQQSEESPKVPARSVGAAAAGTTGANTAREQEQRAKKLIEGEQQRMREKEAQEQRLLAQQLQSVLGAAASPSTGSNTQAQQTQPQITKTPAPPAPEPKPQVDQTKPLTPTQTQRQITKTSAPPAPQQDVSTTRDAKRKQKNSILAQEDVERNIRSIGASRKMAARQRELKMKEAQLEEERETRAREEQRRNSGFVPKIYDEETEEADNDLSESELQNLQQLINRNKEKEKLEEQEGLQAKVDPEARYLKDVISIPPKDPRANASETTAPTGEAVVAGSEQEKKPPALSEADQVVIPLISLVPSENGVVTANFIVVDTRPQDQQEQQHEQQQEQQQDHQQVNMGIVDELASLYEGKENSGQDLLNEIPVIEISEEERRRKERDLEHERRVEELNGSKQEFERIKAEHEAIRVGNENQFQAKLQSVLDKESGVMNKERELLERLTQLETEHNKKQAELELFYNYKLQTAINAIVEEESQLINTQHQQRIAAMNKNQVDFESLNTALTRLHSNVSVQALGTKVLLLKDKLNRQNEPIRVQFYKELMKVKESITNSGEELMKNVVEELDEEVAKEGIYGIGELRGEFERRKKYLIRAQFVPESGGTLGHLAGYLFGRASWMFNDHGGDKSKLREAMDRVDKADLYGAVAVLEEIKSVWVRELVEDWINEARKTMYANQSVKLLNAEMILRLEEERVLSQESGVSRSGLGEAGGS